MSIFSKVPLAKTLPIPTPGLEYELETHTVG